MENINKRVKNIGIYDKKKKPKYLELESYKERRYGMAKKQYLKRVENFIKLMKDINKYHQS